jgi:hypothetical protein
MGGVEESEEGEMEEEGNVRGEKRETEKKKKRHGWRWKQKRVKMQNSVVYVLYYNYSSTGIAFNVSLV